MTRFRAGITIRSIKENASLIQKKKVALDLTSQTMYIPCKSIEDAKKPTNKGGCRNNLGYIEAIKICFVTLKH